MADVNRKDLVQDLQNDFEEIVNMVWRTEEGDPFNEKESLTTALYEWNIDFTEFLRSYS